MTGRVYPTKEKAKEYYPNSEPEEVLMLSPGALECLIIEAWSIGFNAGAAARYEARDGIAEFINEVINGQEPPTPK